MKKKNRAVCAFCGGREDAPARNPSPEELEEVGLVECLFGYRHHLTCPPPGDRDLEKDRAGAILF